MCSCYTETATWAEGPPCPEGAGDQSIIYPDKLLPRTGCRRLEYAYASGENSSFSRFTERRNPLLNSDSPFGNDSANVTCVAPTIKGAQIVDLASFTGTMTTVLRTLPLSRKPRLRPTWLISVCRRRRCLVAKTTSRCNSFRNDRYSRQSSLVAALWLASYMTPLISFRPARADRSRIRPRFARRLNAMPTL